MVERHAFRKGWLNRLLFKSRLKSTHEANASQARPSNAHILLQNVDENGWGAPGNLDDVNANKSRGHLSSTKKKAPLP